MLDGGADMDYKRIAVLFRRGVAMQGARKSAYFFGVLAALLWGPQFMLFRRLLKGKGAPTAPVLAFYFVFGGAVALLLVMFLLGRLPELRIFNRRETHFLVLVATGGYGFWILRSLTMDALDFSTARLLFLTAPLAIGALSAFSREKADGRALFGLALGFVGCILLVGPGRQMAGGLRGALLGLAAAGCWALFSVSARPLVRTESALPVAALVTALGALCLLVTCLSMGEGIIRIGPRQLMLACLAGAVTVGFMMPVWLRCLAGAPAALAGGFWYLGLLFGVLLACRIEGEPHPGALWILGGATLILLGLYGALSGRYKRRRGVSMSDIIRDT